MADLRTSGMEVLLPVINQLQDVFAKVNMVHELNLPQIVVVGAQSTGKSSVLENIVGKDFLPRGSGIVTRRPLVLQMRHLSTQDCQKREAAGEATEFATFLHAPGKVFTDFDEVRLEIESDTFKKCGRSKGVSPDPIRLTVTSPKVLDLTLIDLPGLTKIAVEGQQTTVGQDIERMAFEWIKPANTLILAVTAANTDIANSDALQLARRVDPNGARTIGVLTKLDLMDKGTDCVDVLTGKVVKLQKGFIGLVNRSQHDIDTGKRIQDALTAEGKYFHEHPAYSKYASRLGTAYLTHTLSHNLLLHIRHCLPTLRTSVQDLLKQTREMLREYGTDDMNPSSRLLTLLNLYSDRVRAELDGSAVQEGSKHERLTSGAKINNICVHGFAPHLDVMDPLKDIDDSQIQTIISSCQGTRTKLFIPEQAFENLVRKCIKKLHPPSLKCVEYVHDEMVQLCEEASSVLQRYPVLQKDVAEFTKNFIADLREPLSRFVGELIEMERAYINTNHPDFYDGGSVDQLVQQWASSTSAPNDQHVNPNTNTTGDDTFHSGADFTAPMDQRRERETQVIRTLVMTYFAIVKRHIQDHIPKSIVFFLVNKLQDTLCQNLVQEFYQPNRIPDLLHEGDDIVKRRLAAQNMEACLVEAVDTLNKIRDFKI
eukprot:TRINITY_DN9676_c0_g1_i1.p1 TRINITY_DN9676_c0_g1~~TRINITY_DN9676_c0_g1_i1.p1  ORF type:complete len:739 (+),score=252.62 TRINITY_DN9676_c0_g1_i1:258-2219(+)